MHTTRKKIYTYFEILRETQREISKKSGSSILNIVFFFILGLISAYLILFTPHRYAFLLVFIIMVLIFIILYPSLGVYAYYVIEIIGPQSLVYGAAYPRLALMTALTTGFAGLLMMIRDRLKFVGGKQNYILGGLWIIIFIACIFAQYPSVAWIKFWDFFCKIFIFYFISINLIRTKNQYLGAIWTFVFMFALLGIRGMRAYLVGAKGVSGIGGKLAYDNNIFGMTMVMGLPFMFYPFSMMGSVMPWIKGCILIFFPAIILTIMCTFSRAAFLGMCLVLIVMFLKAKIKSKLLILLLFLFLLPFLPSILPSGYIDRIDTISTYQEDASAMGRIELWKAGLLIIKDFPIFGVGEENFGILAQSYNPKVHFQRQVAHNGYIEMAANNGLIALLLYLLLIGSSLRDLYILKRELISSNKDKWAIPITSLLECSYWGYIMCNIFGSTHDLESFYFLIGLTVMLKNVIGEKKVIKK